MLSKKYFFIGLSFGFILFFVYLGSLPDGKLHIVFCNVGQGDAAYIRSPDNYDMLIDGGPNDKVLTCLGEHMPFYDRTIDLVVLTHPQKDHMKGLISVLNRYHVKNFIIGVEGNQTDGYQRLVDLLRQKNIAVRNLYQGDAFSLGVVKIKLLWPDKNWVAEKIQNPNDKIQIANGGTVLGMATDVNLNEFSYYLHLQYGNFDALFTGDGDRKIQDDIINSTVVPDVDVLKFPHHGSKNGILPHFLDLIKPEQAVISVGKNSYGHPTKEAIDMLESRAIIIKRTDLDGDVEVVTDGKSWQTN